MSRERLDRLLVLRGLAPSRPVAQALVMEGRVRVEGRRVEKAGALVADGASIEVLGPPRAYVGRAGAKLAAALDAFGVAVEGLTALDVGAGAGGFTDCLLQRGAARVYAVDVGHGQIDQRLRADGRVTVIERLNARYIEPSDLPGPADLAVMDVAFISATLILPRIPPLLRGPDVIVLVKPQFEVGRGQVGRGGVVRDPDGWRRAIRSVLEASRACGLRPAGLISSPLAGAEGNQEFLLRLAAGPDRKGAAAPAGSLDPAALVEEAVAAAARRPAGAGP
jgi:23S rRNA (cytidine1920-2'-O)/16S rRNA (cytidine1409-2'-O)-methyltransferase